MDWTSKSCIEMVEWNLKINKTKQYHIGPPFFSLIKKNELIHWMKKTCGDIQGQY